MKNISQIFQGNEHLMDLSPVEELIDYTQELEGQLLERKYFKIDTLSCIKK